MQNISPITRISIAVAIIMVLGAVIFWPSVRQVVAGQAATTCAPTATDGVDASTIAVNGLDVSWAAHAQACAYRVSLRESSGTEDLHSVQNTTDTGYTIPSGLLTDGSKYEVTVKILDAVGNPVGLAAIHKFVYEMPLCSPVSGPGPVPTPMAMPTPDPNCRSVPPVRAVTDDPVITSGSTGPGSWSGVGPESYRPSGAGADDSYFSLARNILKCNTTGNDCPANLANVTGVRHIGGPVSFKEPTRSSGTSWDDYHFFNGLHVVRAGTDSDGDLETITCPTTASDDNHSDTDLTILYTGPEMLALGIAHGRFGDAIYRNEIIIQAFYRDPGELDDNDNAKVRCKIFPTGALISDHTAITMGIEGGETPADWRFYATHHGFRGRTITTQWASATSVSYGQEIWARNGDKDSVYAPFNYVDKVMVSLHASGSLVPWYESVLPTGLQNRSEQIRHDPFVINDSVPDDYTSLSACTIEPGTRLCWAPKAQ